MRTSAFSCSMTAVPLNAAWYALTQAPAIISSRHPRCGMQGIPPRPPLAPLPPLLPPRHPSIHPHTLGARRLWRGGELVRQTAPTPLFPAPPCMRRAGIYKPPAGRTARTARADAPMDLTAWDHVEREGTPNDKKSFALAHKGLRRGWATRGPGLAGAQSRGYDGKEWDVAIRSALSEISRLERSIAMEEALLGGVQDTGGGARDDGYQFDPHTAPRFSISPEDEGGGGGGYDPRGEESGDPGGEEFWDGIGDENDPPGGELGGESDSSGGSGAGPPGDDGYIDEDGPATGVGGGGQLYGGTGEDPEYPTREEGGWYGNGYENARLSANSALRGGGVAPRGGAGRLPALQALSHSAGRRSVPRGHHNAPVSSSSSILDIMNEQRMQSFYGTAGWGGGGWVGGWGVRSCD